MELSVLFLRLEEVLKIHENQITLYGGSPGIRDEKLLEAALAQPEASYAGNYLHADIYSMAAAYMYHLAMDHPFVDGNKRVATVCALIFLELNNYELDVSNEILEKTVFELASSHLAKDDLVDFYKRNTKPLS